MTKHTTYCRFCHAFCGLEVEIEDDRLVAVKGDREHPVSKGYTCIKGRQLAEQHNDPNRLREARYRKPDGTYASIPSAQAMDEIAQKLSDIIKKHGPRAVALYNGTKSWTNVAMSISRSWLNGIGSPSYYSSTTIDQPARVMGWALHGSWKAGENVVTDCDVAVFIGANPLRSFTSVAGKLPPANAMDHLRDAVKRGTKIISIDPRSTETGRFAHMHLQIKPGEDASLLAGMVRFIIDEKLYDQDFIAQNADRLNELRKAVEPFTLDYVERRTGIKADELIAATRIIAKGPRLSMITGTGTNMAPHPLSTEVLANCISTMCGGWLKEGQKICHAGLLQKPYVPRAEANNPFDFWAGTPVQPRIRGLRSLTGEMPTPALAEEIMTPGEGQVRALIVNGGNPVAAIPDQRAAVKALKSLDLLVVLDVMMSSTSKIADYVFGCKLSMEKPDFTRNHEFFSSAPFAQYSPALIKPNFDVIEEWEFFWGMANRMRVPLFLGQPTSSFTSATDNTGVAIDIDKKPSTDELMEIEATGSRIPLQELKQYPRGIVSESAQVKVEPRDPATAGRFDMAPELFLEDLQRVLDKPITVDGAYDLKRAFSHRLVSRRMLQVYNSTGVHLEELNTEGPGNPAYLNPRDMEVAGIGAGDLIEIESEHGKIVCVAKAEKGLRSGVISMAHAWGDLPPEEGEEIDVQRGASTNLLISTNEHYDPLVGMCRQSAIPVNIRRAEMRA